MEKLSSTRSSRAMTQSSTNVKGHGPKNNTRGNRQIDVSPVQKPQGSPVIATGSGLAAATNNYKYPDSMNSEPKPIVLLHNIGKLLQGQTTVKLTRTFMRNVTREGKCSLSHWRKGKESKMKNVENTEVDTTENAQETGNYENAQNTESIEVDNTENAHKTGNDKIVHMTENAHETGNDENVHLTENTEEIESDESVHLTENTHETENQGNVQTTSRELAIFNQGNVQTTSRELSIFNHGLELQKGFIYFSATEGRGLRLVRFYGGFFSPLDDNDLAVFESSARTENVSPDIPPTVEPNAETPALADENSTE